MTGINVGDMFLRRQNRESCLFIVVGLHSTMTQELKTFHMLAVADIMWLGNLPRYHDVIERYGFVHESDELIAWCPNDS